MTTTLVAAVSLAFVTGLGVGVRFSDGIRASIRPVRERVGHTRRMRRLRAALSAVGRWASHYWRPLVIVLISASLIFNATTGLIAIASKRNYADLTQCLKTYNEKDGKARDERASKSVAGTDAAIAWLKALREGILHQSLSTQGLVKTIDLYSGALKTSKKTQAKNPYPPPNYCSENGEGRK